jgi:hypothetical protein
MGWGNKTGPFDYPGHPVPLFGGEISKQDAYVLKGGPLGGWGLAVKSNINHFKGSSSGINASRGGIKISNFVTKYLQLIFLVH